MRFRSDCFCTRSWGMFSLLTLVVLTGGCQQQRGESIPDVAPRLQETLDSLRGGVGFPGATAAIVTPTGAVRAVATGYADREDSTLMTPGTRMLGGSTGKSFVAAVVLRLAQDDVVGLDAPISQWLGTRAWFDRLPNADSLTLRHLLRHQSGLIDHIHSSDFRRAMQRKRATAGPGAVLAPIELVQFVLDRDPLFHVGEGYHYSDTNYILAGLVVEAATGTAYSDVLQRRFLGPLSLSDTAPSRQRDLPRLAAGYIEGDRPFGLPPKVTDDGVLVYNPATEWTGGGLVTTSRDLARWARALYDGEALPEDVLDLLLDAVPKDSSQQARFGPDVRYGLGVTIRSTSLGPAYGHRGWTPGYLSVFEYYPNHGVAVAMQVNASGSYDMADYAVQLARSVVNEPPV